MLAPVSTSWSTDRASRRLAADVGELVALRAENADLREQNAACSNGRAPRASWRSRTRGCASCSTPRPRTQHPTAVTARVVADAGGPFVQTVMVNAGADQGVVNGMAAVNERGLVGRVIEVGRRSARILLLTDFNSRIPVMVEPSRDQAILAGDNSREPGLMFLPLNPRLSVGDRVVTSGRGGVLPPGLAIGVVSAIGEQQGRGHAAGRLGPPGLSAPAGIRAGAAAGAARGARSRRSTGRRRRPAVAGAGPAAPAPAPAAGRRRRRRRRLMTWLRQLDAQLRALLPFATALLAVLIDVAPLVGTGPAGLTSFATLCAVYFWSLYRPDLFTPSAAFADRPRLRRPRRPAARPDLARAAAGAQS